ncbi:MAG: F0F1 ATP synthase subunit delta [Pseudomonadales bacterium]|jgi:F-type H+-transporting ATPase subunit delta
MAEAELATIARPYARAAFAVALDVTDGLDTWSRMLALLAAALSEDLIREALDNPRLSGEDEANLLITMFGDDLNDEGKNFVGVLAEYDRIELLPEIADMFALLKANHEKTMEIQVTSAFEVTDAQKEVLAEALQRKLQRTINLETRVNKTLIGGVVIKAEDTVIDSSVRGKLQKMSHALS